MAGRETRLSLIEGMRFAARTASGQEFVIDTSPDVGGAGGGPTPMELQLVALGGCSAMDIIAIARKMRQPVESYDVRIVTERAAEHPKVYTSATVTHEFRGSGLSEEMLRRALELTITRYCPVHAMLTPKVKITNRYRITDDATGATVEGEAHRLEEAPRPPSPGKPAPE